MINRFNNNAMWGKAYTILNKSHGTVCCRMRIQIDEDRQLGVQGSHQQIEHWQQTKMCYHSLED